MSKPTVAELPGQLYTLLEPLTAEERGRVIQATLVLFGDAPTNFVPAGVQSAGKDGGNSSPQGGGSGLSPQQFMDEKDPRNKGEIFAVAAKYLEDSEGQEEHSKADLKRVIVEARRNFDDAHFTRDMGNAKRQAGLFNLNTGRDASRLSYYGHQYVDALPDRDAISKLKRPKVGGAKKKAASKKKADK
ncbi:MAG: hypothetical protein AB2794_09210 [Candidatus Thiodiazotropha endolucinida]